MNRMLSLLLLVLAATCVSPSQTVEEEIRKVIQDQADAWNRGDIEGYMRGYWNSEETLFISGGNLTRGYQE